MRAAWVVCLAAIARLPAQTLVPVERIPASLRRFEPQPDDRPLPCQVVAAHPILDFGFRFQTGFSASVSTRQYSGRGRFWSIVARVTPRDGAPAYLMARVRLPQAPAGNNSASAQTSGGFFVGPGEYRVEWALYDSEGRVCRKQWKITASLKHAERHVTPAVPPGAVADFSGGGLSPSPPRAPGIPPLRLTILLDAAPASARRLHLRFTDRALLISTLSSLLETMQPASARLEVFNLDKQRVLYGAEDFTRRSLTEVYQALNHLETDTIDVKTLGNPLGYEDLLASLIRQEESSPQPADAVIFLGPATRFTGKIAELLERPPEGMRFYYFEYKRFPGMAEAELPDSISNAVSRLKGRVFTIYTPGQFAEAILAVAQRR
jgi:hypothetical protein